jgi:hypothetical protein
MPGSLTGAGDPVQEAWLRLSRTGTGGVAQRLRQLRPAVTGT